MTAAGMERWRTVLLYVLVVGALGILAELLLLGHDDDTLQFIPSASARRICSPLPGTARRAPAVRSSRCASSPGWRA
ncbi:MAG: hypothetical protein IPJ11_03725 [Gemmatimonadetes bacterium]|nr:hypothetical protein [Gemmatimonadota bacterium]